MDKNRVEPPVEQAVVNMAYEQPAFGQHRVADELANQGVMVSGSGVRSIWLRHNLESFKKRLHELQADVDQWIHWYNQERCHSGKHCYEKTPWQTWQDSLSLAKEKQLDQWVDMSDSATCLTNERIILCMSG